MKNLTQLPIFLPFLFYVSVSKKKTLSIPPKNEEHKKLLENP